MKCPECNGHKNFVSLAGTPFEVVKPCKRCNGTGEIEITEQEYIQTCNTEQLAEEIYKCIMTHPWHISKEVILEWLKQPHHDEVAE
jgi:DnaJ-class molecular chaperone